MSVVGSIPIQLRARDQADYYRKVPPFLPITYAYCLLDLTADESDSPNKVFQKIPGFLSEKISDEITWQLPCRTNGKGFLVPIDEKNLSDTWKNLFYRNDSGAYSYIDKLQPLLINLGMNFNLFWTYNKNQFDSARKLKNLIVKENQLQLCSTMFNSDESKTFLQILIRPELNLRRTDKAKFEDLVKKIRSLLLRDQRNYKRFVVHSGIEFVGLDKFKVNPNLPIEDYDLKKAIYISDMILTASTTPQDYDFIGHIARLEEVLKIIKNRGEEKSLNDIIGLHTRIERVESSYSLAKWRIESIFKTLSNYIDDCGKRLEKVYSNSIIEAIGHYKPDIGKEYIEKIQKAATIYCSRKLWDDFICSDEKYKQKMKAVKEVIDGKPPKDFLEAVLSSYQKYDAAGLDKYIGFTEKTTEWMESLIPKLVKQKPTQIVGALNRMHHFLTTIDDIDNVNKKVEEVFKVVDQDISIAVKNADGKPVNIKVKESIGKVGNIAGHAAKLVSFINVSLALKEAMENPDFKNCLKTFKEASDAANAFKSVREQLTKHFGITESILTKFAASAMIVLSFIEAADHLKQGNNVAILGDMIVATGGTMQILTKGGLAGWIAAGIILAGTVLVYFSLDNDEKFLLSFEKKYWTPAKYATDLRFLRTKTTDFNYVDEYLKIRGK